MAMLIATTPTLDNRPVLRYLGLVSGEAILGANILKDVFAGFRDIIGGRAGAYEEELQRAKTLALAAMTEQATQLGANAVIGVDLDFETVGQGMLMVCASGTAVIYEEPALIPAGLLDAPVLSAEQREPAPAAPQRWPA